MGFDMHAVNTVNRHEGVTAADLVDLAPAARELSLLRAMAYVRAFEERVEILYKQGQVRGPAHLGLGHEAVAVGVGAALGPDDRSIGTYRGHAHALVRGADPQAVMLELLGRSGGICDAKGGSMHICSVEHGYMGSHAIIGAHLPIAAGLGWASQLTGDNSVTACFFGDGTTNIGAFHEALTLAAVWKLPVVFVCENNGYMEYTPIESVTPVARPAADRASAYGLAPVVVDGNDVHAVREAAVAAVDAARAGLGPSLIEARTYRHGGHSVADPGAYRPADEVTAWKERDPILRQVDVAVAAGADRDEASGLLARLRDDVAQLAQVALDAPAPEPGQAWSDMWADGGVAWRN